MSNYYPNIICFTFSTYFFNFCNCEQYTLLCYLDLFYNAEQFVFNYSAQNSDIFVLKVIYIIYCMSHVFKKSPRISPISISLHT